MTGGPSFRFSRFFKAQLLGMCAVFLFGFSLPAYAEKPAWAGKVVDQSHAHFTFEAGKRATVWFDFKNLGTQTWEKSGRHFVAMNVTNPVGRVSSFRDQSWKTYYRPTPLDTPDVKPGEVGRFKFIIQVPEVAGEYTEHFALVAEDLTWIPETDFSMNIRVLPNKPFRASLVEQSHPVLSMTPGEQREVWFDVRNTGPVAWRREGRHFIALETAEPKRHESEFADEDWLKPFRPTRLDQTVVEPGEVGRFTFALHAPTELGSTTENFRLVAEGFTSFLKLSISLIVLPPSVSTEAVVGEPDLRVGLFETPEKEVDIVPRNGNATVVSNGKTVLTVPEDVSVRLRWTGSLYRVRSMNQDFLMNDPPRVIPETSSTILEIMNFEQRPAWNLSLNDNTFRGILELRFASSVEQVWVINELPLEAYLRGIAEAGDDNEPAYLKALLIAARTYAMFHRLTGTKHRTEGFHVNGTTDQVYRGYGFEQRSPNLTRLVEETKGIMVTSEGAVAITPYFSWTDGRTRAWDEVWAGDGYPHLQSKADPCCGDRELFGHGVGMSALGASWFASERGWTENQILTYYYTGVELKKFYGN